MTPEKRVDIIHRLQTDILRLEGNRPSGNPALDVGLGPISAAFPQGTFPTGAVHEFIAETAEDGASTLGFITGLLSSLMGNNGATVWISSRRTLFPPALRSYGVQPDRFIFLDVKREKDVLWAMEESLKCGALTTVVGEVRDLDFTASRRLQLAIEKSQVTGLILRSDCRKMNATACVSRWKITPLPSESVDDLPGIGFPAWRVELLRIRNGKSGVWDIQWRDGRFVPAYQLPSVFKELQKNTG